MASDATAPATVEEARAFVDQVERELRELWVARDRAHWVAQTYITPDTEALRAGHEAETAAYVTRKAHEAQRFAGLSLLADVARKLHLLVVTQEIPAPSDPLKAKELAGTLAAMDGAYGEGKFCPPKGSKLTPFLALLPTGETCLHLDDLDGVLQKSRDAGVLTEAWNAWYETARRQRDRYVKFVAEANEGARELGFPDVGALWRSNFDMTPADLEADADRLWNDVKPLYEELHCYVRAKLRAKYGKDKVPEHGPIPEQYLGNMWAQSWEGVFDLVAPYKGSRSDVSKMLRAKKTDAKSMVKMGESFFTSSASAPRDLLGALFAAHAPSRPRGPLPRLRLGRELGRGPAHRMCITPDEENLLDPPRARARTSITSRTTSSPSFQFGANAGFHEGARRHDRSQRDAALPEEPRAPRRASHRRQVAHQPADEDGACQGGLFSFGLRIDKWRWDVFAGKITLDHFNATWRVGARLPASVPPEARTEDDFDPAAKYHVASATPTSSTSSPPSTSSSPIALPRAPRASMDRSTSAPSTRSTAAGQKLRAMLSMGASKPWQDALEAMSGEEKGDAGAILEYFAFPLRAWLKD